ncbi:MAG TPA: hypothetical protein PKO12_05870, partial [Holophaga sp.]|nr:hypothetical protein [Holophaga sp.]
MATPDSGNIYLGAGEVWFNRFDASGNATQWRHLGNVSRLEPAQSVETLEKRSAMSGARGLLKRVVTSTTSEVSMTLDEFDPENVALALLGTAAAFSQSSGTATDSAVTGTVKKGQWLETGKLKITVTAVKKSGGATLNANEYEVDSDTGMIKILSTASTVADGDSITWSGSYAAVTSTQVQALANSRIEGALRFRSASDAVGPRYLVDFWKVAITPDGALALLTT